MIKTIKTTKNKNEFFNVTNTDYGALVTKKDMKGLYILVVVTNEYKGGITSIQVQKNWGEYVANKLDMAWHESMTTIK